MLELPHALVHGARREPHRRADVRVRGATIRLQGREDREIPLIEHGGMVPHGGPRNPRDVRLLAPGSRRYGGASSCPDFPGRTSLAGLTWPDLPG